MAVNSDNGGICPKESAGGGSMSKTIIAPGQTQLVVTNNLVSATSIIMACVAKNDASIGKLTHEKTAGAFTLFVDNAPDAETPIEFAIFN